MATVRVREGESLENALKLFKRQVSKDGTLIEARKREAYVGPSLKRKKKSEEAHRRKRMSNYR